MELIEPVWNISTVEEYKALPLSSRTTFFGLIYRTPFSLEWYEWDDFDTYIKKEYPIQYRIRDFFLSVEIKYSRIKSWFYDRYLWIFRPAHPILRKSFPREWHDLTSLIIDINFAIILQFEDEMKNGWVDWQATEHHAAFAEWMKKAVNYIKVERPALLDAMYNSAPDTNVKLRDRKLEDYDEWRRIEQLIESKDAELIKEMVDNRHYFWT
jgi:hypothetical protein